MPLPNELEADTLSANKNLADSEQQFDAIVIGASMAGSVCALSLARKGWRVAVIEKRSDLDFYKKICTHIIHPSGLKVLETFDLMPELYKSSAQNTAMKIEFSGRSIYFPFKGKPKAANIERRDIDPLLKKRLDEHDNISCFFGHSLQELRIRNNRVIGAQVISSDKPPIVLRANIIIGADGRDSHTARLANARHQQQQNHRVALFRYFDALDDEVEAESKVWALQQGAEYVGYFPNKQHTLVSWYISESFYQANKGEIKAKFENLSSFFQEKNLRLGHPASSIMTAKQTAPESMHVSLERLVLVGDAKHAADPLTGVGCSWAMSSGVMLAASLGKAPSQDELPARLNARIKFAVFRYHLYHTLRFKLPSRVMSFASMHGKWIFNRPVYGFLSWLTRK